MQLRLVGVALLILGAIARADLTDEAWTRLRREADSLAHRSGAADRKFAFVDEITTEDSARSAQLTLGFAAAAFQRSVSAEKQLAKAERDFAKINRALRKKLGRSASRADLEKDSHWKSRRRALNAAEENARTEQTLLRVLRASIGEFRSAEAAAVLVDAKSARARRSPDVRRGVLAALWHQPVTMAAPHLIGFARDADLPEERARVLDWIGRKKVEAGFAVALVCLHANESSVVRAAVAALKQLDNPRCVPALVKARLKAKGQLAEDLEYALNHYTGKKFFGPGSEDSWNGWWKAEGASWLERQTGESYGSDAVPRKGSAHFYGIPTRSNRIVFVLDRSGSMKDPVPQRAVTTGKPPADWVPGKNKMEVAKNQLARSIRGLQPDVEFAVVFYSHEVHIWQKKMMKATPANKKEAIEWFMRLKPVGSTMIFDALAKALEFAPKGADTIFLLSDGAPSTPDGRDLLRGKPLEDAIRGFFDANKAHRCIVHAVSVGKEADRSLMERLARETGGTHRVVGAK